MAAALEVENLEAGYEPGLPIVRAFKPSAKRKTAASIGGKSKR